MIRKATEMQVEVRKEMRGGNGEVEIRHIFSKDELTGRCRLLAKITLAPGCSIGLHEHVDEEEIYYIVKGTAQVTDSGVTTELSVGDAVLTGGGKSHSIENTGDGVLELVAVILLY